MKWKKFNPKFMTAMMSKKIMLGEEEAESVANRLYRKVFGSDLLDDATYPSKVTDYLYLGCCNNAKNISVLQELNIQYVLNVAPNTVLTSFLYYKQNGLLLKKYLQFPCHDELDFPLAEYFEPCFQFINECREQKSNILVHCAAGVSRSAAIVVFYLMKQYQWNLEQALQFLKEKRCVICPNKSFMKQLVLWENKTIEDSSN